jgi:hypothetical protein
MATSTTSWGPSESTTKTRASTSRKLGSGDLGHGIRQNLTTFTSCTQIEVIANGALEAVSNNRTNPTLIASDSIMNHMSFRRLGSLHFNNFDSESWNASTTGHDLKSIMQLTIT